MTGWAATYFQLIHIPLCTCCHRQLHAPEMMGLPGNVSVTAKNITEIHTYRCPPCQAVDRGRRSPPRSVSRHSRFPQSSRPSPGARSRVFPQYAPDAEVCASIQSRYPVISPPSILLAESQTTYWWNRRRHDSMTACLSLPNAVSQSRLTQRCGSSLRHFTRSGG